MRKAICLVALALTAALVFAACERAEEAGGANTAQLATTNQAAANQATGTQPVASAPTPNVPAASTNAGALPSASPATPPAMPPGVVRRISVDEARAAFERREAIFIDVRGDEAFRQGHIPGAVMIMTNEVAQKAGKLPRNKLIITYCT